MFECLNTVTLATDLGGLESGFMNDLDSWSGCISVSVYSFMPSSGRVRGGGGLWRHLCFCGLGAWQLPQSLLLVNRRCRFPCASVAQMLSVSSTEVS